MKNRNHIIAQCALLWLLAIFSMNLLAQNEESYLLYDIPTDAKKLGPIGTRDPHQTFYKYFLSGSELSDKTLLGRETYYDKQLIRRDLYKNGQEHGIQREWYHDGKPKSESPYKNGVMEGVFKHWNEAGQLIGQYEIKDGSGTKKIYNETGELVWEQEMANSQGNGFLTEVTAIAKIRSFVWLKNGNHIGQSFSFYPDGNLCSITCSSAEGYLHGPHIGFAANGDVREKQWFVNRKEVNESEYEAAASSDPSLPPYYTDASQYQQFVTADILALLEKYRTMPRVKMPLQFDQR